MSSSVVAVEAENSAERAAARRLAAQLDDGSDLSDTLRHLLDDVANGERVLIMRASHDVTPADAARILGVTRQFVDRLCAEGVLPFHRLPDSRHRRISVADVIRVAGERDRRRSGRATIKAALDVE